MFSALVFPSSFSARPNSTQIAALNVWKTGGDKWTRLREFRCRASTSSLDLDYQFRDDGGELELRVKLPHGHKDISSKNVAVNAQDMSLDVALLSQQGVTTLLNVSRLYSRIKPVETVWCIDEDEVVLSLKKLDSEQAWPGLLEAWEFLGKGVAGMLKSTSIFIVGESTEINAAVAKELAVALRYVPLETKGLIEKLAKAPLDEFSEAEGPEAISELESQILENLSKQLKVVVATLGGGYGAAVKEKNWKYLYSGITVWISQSQAQDEDEAEKEVVKAKEVESSPYTKAETVVALAGWEEDAARPAAEGCLRAIKYLIESDKELPGKKRLYIRLGARGDWPDIMPPGWNPDSS